MGSSPGGNDLLQRKASKKCSSQDGISMEFFKAWILPPLVGAIIGYFTNWLAIKMLFRPYKTIKFAGIALPFTPGLLPREKDKLAVSLGETVSKELLTAEVITQRIQSADIKQTILKAIKSALASFFNQDAGRIFSQIGEPGLEEKKDDEPSLLLLESNGQKITKEVQSGNGTTIDSEVSALQRNIIEALQHLVERKSVQSSIEGIFAEFLNRIGKLSFKELVSKEQFIASVLKACSTLQTRVLSESNHEQSLQSSKSKSSRFNPLLKAVIDLPPDVTIMAFTDALVPQVYTWFLDYIDSFFHSEGFRARLETEAQAFVKRALDRLGPIQRLFISIAGYDAKIAQAMPENIEDLIQTIERILKDPSTPQSISKTISRAIINWRSKDEAETTKTGPEIYQRADDSIGSKSRVVSEQIVLSLKDSSEDLRLRAEAIYYSLADLEFGEILGIRSNEEAISGFVFSIIVPTMHVSDSSASNTMGSIFIEVLKDVSKGKTFADILKIQDSEIERISVSLTDGLIELIQSRISTLIDAFDITSMVSERIDSLDMKEVERIVLQVVKKELAWITWLGGILGGMIGFIQSIISTF